MCLLKSRFLSCMFSFHSSVTFLLKSIAHGSWMPSGACSPVTLRGCLAELGWGGKCSPWEGQAGSQWARMVDPDNGNQA